MAARISRLMGSMCFPLPIAINELRNGWPSMVPRTFTRPRVPKNSTDPGQITYVQLPLPMPFFRTALNCLSIIPLYLPWPASVRRGCVTVLLLFVPRRVPRRSLLCRSSVRGHRSEIMFSVLVVVLRPDHIAGQGGGNIARLFFRGFPDQKRLQFHR